MKSIAILVTHDYYPNRPDRSEPDYAGVQLKLLGGALKAKGFEAIPVFWQDEGNEWRKFAAVLPLMAWNYPREVDLFIRRLKEIEASGVALLNTADVVAANMDKNYLAELAAKGAPVPPTISVEVCTAQAISDSFDILNCDEIIIKPRIGAGAWRQARLMRGEDLPSADMLPPGAALIQPFLPSVATQGELSMLYFGGVFSHALMKTPQKGDYRTQGQYGAREVQIDAPQAAHDAATIVLAKSYGAPHTYARVDLVQGEGGAWLLMELELIEPWLYLSFDGADGHKAAGLAASAILEKISQIDTNPS